MTPEESLRLHVDWWGKCRTCQFWGGNRASSGCLGLCANPRSLMKDHQTSWDGYCPQWDSFDIDTALDVSDGVCSCVCHQGAMIGCGCPGPMSDAHECRDRQNRGHPDPREAP